LNTEPLAELNAAVNGFRFSLSKEGKFLAPPRPVCN